MDVTCAHCGEPWSDYFLRHDLFYDACPPTLRPTKASEKLFKEAWKAGKYEAGAKLFDEITSGEYVEFLTLPAYRQID